MFGKQFFVVVLIVVGMMPGLAQASKTVLMVVSGYGEDGGDTKPGYEFDEFAKAYLVFRDQGYIVDIASPDGGAVEADEYNPEKPFNELVINDTAIMAKLADTLATYQVDAKDYDAVFIVGGKGAMFDLPFDPSLKQFVADVYESGDVVAAVCHGPAALVDVKLSNGEYLVAGKRVNGFTNIEEKAFGKKWVESFPFLLEDRLVERGGRFEKSPMMLSHVAADARLITGQNPFSTTPAAQAVVRALGDEPVASEPFMEDVTMSLIAGMLAGDKASIDRLNQRPDTYQVELVGMYGYYAIQFAETPEHVQQAVTLMTIANETMQHPVLEMAVVDGHRQLGQLDVALSKARQLAEAHPDNEQAQTLLASLEAS